MKRATQLLVVALVIACFGGNALAEEQANPFYGFWRTERGSIIKVDGDQGVFVYTPVESWKEYVDQVVVKNIRQVDGQWVADEYIAPEGRPFWAEIQWKLDGDRIVREASYQGKTVESYYGRIDAVTADELSAAPVSQSARKEHKKGSREGNRGKFGIGGRVLYVSYPGDRRDDLFGSRIDVDPNEAAMFGGTLTWFAHEYFSFELSGDYVKTDVELKTMGINTTAGELTQIPVLLTLRTHFSTNPRVSPYLGVGGGWYFNDFDLERQVVSTINTLLSAPVTASTVQVEVDDNYGFHVSGGVELFVTSWFAIDLHAKYVWNECKVSTNQPALSSYEFDADAFVGGIGLKLYF